jgi:hypothetical protein
MTKRPGMLLGCNKGFPYKGFSDVRYIKRQDQTTNAFITENTARTLKAKKLSSNHVRNLSEA